MNKYLAPTAVGVALVVVVAIAFWPKGDGEGDGASGGSEATASGGDGEQVEMTMHIMSKCPYGVKVVQAVTPVARKLGNRFKLNLEYIGREQDGELNSMHGEPELNGDKIQLCAHEHGSYTAWLGFMECQNENWRSIPEGWERCAREAELDVGALTECYNGEEGTRLVRASFRASEKAGAGGSPTMFLNGEPYQGGRTEEAFARALCSQYSGSAPGYCAEIPAPPEVPVTVLVDNRCDRPECDTKRQIAALKTRIPGAKVTEVDYSTARGRELFEEAGLKMLPAILIGREVQQDREAMGALKGMKRSGENFVDQLGRFDPTKGEWLERPEVPIRILVDSRCDTRECESLPRFEAFIKGQIPRAKISQVNYVDDEGRALWKTVSDSWGEPEKGPRGQVMPLGLPVALFGKSIELETEVYSRIERRFRPIGDEYAFQLGGWDPTSEICDNETDDDGDGQADCSDSDCAEQMVCRDEAPRKLQAFVMSQCPYGVQVLDAMGEVLENFGRDRTKIDFRIEFIGDVNEEGELSSMHGQGEIDEDLRELCAQQHYAKNYQFMDYVSCRNKNIRSNEWEECATGAIKADVIRRCAEGEEGRNLLRASFELAKSLNIGGSPSWLLNNRFDMNGRSPEDIKTQFCEHNEQPECTNTLTKAAPGRGNQGGCG
jgi:hypothetical protein